MGIAKHHNVFLAISKTGRGWGEEFSPVIGVDIGGKSIPHFA